MKSSHRQQTGFHEAIAEKESGSGHVSVLESPDFTDPSDTTHKTFSDGTRVRLAYLLSQYPAISHTFFLHEVIGLRAIGVDIETISINEPDRTLADLPLPEQAEAKRTHYLKSSKLHAFREATKVLLINPGVVMRGLQAWWAVPDLPLRRKLYWLLYLAEAIVLGAYLRKNKLTHLHVHFGGAVAAVGMLTSLAWQIPYSLTIHGPEELTDTTAYQLRKKTAVARFVVCISDYCRSQLFQLTPPEEWHKFHVVRLGVDTTELHPAFPGEAVSIGRTPLIVSTGRLVPAKGHLILLEALRKLRDQGVIFSAVIIGGGPERGRLNQFVHANDLTSRVRFTSALSHHEALEVMRDADIFTLASFAEGVPVAIMEAMSLAKACVATNIAGIPQLIRDRIDGSLVPPANSHALADALAALLSDPELRRRYGVSAREHITEFYNLPINHRLLASLFAQYINGDGTPEGSTAL